MGLRRVLRIGVLGLVAGGSVAQGGPTTVPTVPELHGTVLSGAAVALPDSLRGKTAVLVVGFSQGSRAEVTDWGRRLAVDYRDSTTVAYYEMPVLAGVPKLLRGWVLKKVTEEVPDRAKSHCLPVMDHEAEWKAAVGFDRDEDAYVVVVDEGGRVIWRTTGAVSDAAFAEVKRHLAPTP